MSARSRLVVAAALAAGLLAGFGAGEASAFDGRRKGFLLGFGAGPATVSSPHYIDDTIVGVASHLEVGAGLDDRWILHYAGKSVFDLWSDSHIQLVPAVGLTRYFDEEAGSLYLTAGYGGQLLAGDNIEFFAGGHTLFGGVGYEFPDQWNVELEYLNSFDSAATTHTFMLTVGVVAY